MDATAEHLDKSRPGFLAADGEDRWADVAFAAHAGAHFRCDPGWELVPRTRPNYQVWLITGQSADFVVDNGEPIPLPTRSALVLPPGVPHSATHDPRLPLRCSVLHFMARSQGLPAGDILPACALRGLSQPVWAALTAAADEMCEHLASDRPGRRLLANAAVTRIVGLLRSASDNADRRLLVNRPPLPKPVAQMLRYLRRHHAEPLSLTAIAQAAHLSPERAGHVFRAAVGVSPLRYLRDYRLADARRMLCDTDLPVAAIAARVGFADPFYFSRVFSKSEGMSPSGYRESVRGELLI